MKNQDVVVACEGLTAGGDRPDWAPLTLRLDAGRVYGLEMERRSSRLRLLNILGLAARPAGGDIAFEGVPMNALSSKERATFRRLKVGWVQDVWSLLPALSVAENLAVPLFRDRPVEADEARVRIESALRYCGVGELAGEDPSALDTEQRQRVLFARALILRPRLVLGEILSPPTVWTSLGRKVARQHGVTVVWGGASHGSTLSEFCDTVVRVSTG